MCIIFEQPEIFSLICGERKLKNLIIINGTMGVGKTAVSKELKLLLTAFS